MIGVFDSGVGGLNYLKQLHRVLGEYDTIYLGDQLRVPYGGRSPEAIQQFSEECIQKLWDLGATLIVIACNTACAEALAYLQHKYPQKKILGIIIPGVEASLKFSGNIGVIATKGTIQSHAYKKEVIKKDSERNVFEVAAPLLVPFIEEMYAHTSECKKITKKYLRLLKDAKVKNLILACTHYPHMKNVFKKIMGPQVNIIDPGEEAVYQLQEYLHKHQDIEKKLSKNKKYTFYTTDCKENFMKQLELFYGKKYSVTHIKII
jgi:glutamate racemase